MKHYWTLVLLILFTFAEPLTYGNQLERLKIANNSNRIVFKEILSERILLGYSCGALVGALGAGFITSKFSLVVGNIGLGAFLGATVGIVSINLGIKNWSFLKNIVLNIPETRAGRDNHLMQKILDDTPPEIRTVC